MEEKDLEYLREQLSRLDEPELPPSLTAEALFARLDEGTLALPEEEAPRAEPKVIPWARIARRWAPLAACLVLVLLLYRGYEVGLAKNFVNGAAPQMAGDYDATASGAAIPEPTAYSPYDEESAEEGEGEEKSLLRSAADAPMEAAEDGDSLRKSTPNTGVTNSPAASAPAPSGRPDIGPPSDGLPPAPAPEPDHGGSSGGSSSKPNPDTGGGDSHPDTGGPDPTTPPDFSQDSGENGPSLYKQVKAQMEEIAARYNPDPSLVSKPINMITTDELLIFDAVYRDENRVTQAQIRFYCLYFEGKGDAWLEVQTYKLLD